jgi:excisionase family DNA binding protein
MSHGIRKRHDQAESNKEESAMTRTKTIGGAPAATTSRTELLTVDDVAAVLKVPKSTLYQWSYQGDGPPVVRVGRHLRYPSDRLDSWIESGLKEQSSER